MSERSQKFTLKDTVSRQRERKQNNVATEPKEEGLTAFFSWTARLSLLFVICASPWMIASVTPGAQLIIASVLLIALASWWIESGLASGQRQILPYVLLFVVLGMAIGLLQTIALPDSLANVLAGRQTEIAEKYLSDPASATGPPKRLSLDIEGTWHQLRLLVIAATCLLIGGRYFRGTRHLATFLSVVLINGVALTAFGLVQKMRFNGKLFWEIELTQGGSPFGPFICRNNAAGYLVMCLSAGVGLLLLLMTQRRPSKPHQIVSDEIPVWRQATTYIGLFVAQLDARRLAILIACIFISIGVVATLSRGGVVTLLAAWIGGCLIYNLTRKPKFAGLLMAPVVLLVIALVSWVGFADDLVKRFESIDTLSESTIDARLDTWRDTLPAALDHGWFGTGLGSYRSVHRLYRTDPELQLFEYAENQYVQSVVEAGLPGLVLLLMALAVSYWYVSFLLARGSSGRTIGTGLFGAFLLVGQTIAAVFDFGWYVPANMVLFAAGMGIVAHQAHSLAGRLKKKSWLKFECPKAATQIVILGTFLCSIFVVYDLYHKSAIYDEVRPVSVGFLDPISFDRSETDERVQRLAPLVNKSPTISGLNTMGDLYVHRARLQYLDLLKSSSQVASLSGEQQAFVDSNLWNLTGLVRIHEYISSLERNKDQIRLNRFKQQDFFQIDLPQALLYFQASQKSSPLQPRTQFLIGLLTSILGDYDRAKVELEKAIELSPQNPGFRFSAAMVMLQREDSTAATEHLKHYVELKPRQFVNVLNILTGKSNRDIVPLEERVIFETVMGDDPEQLYVFGKDYVLDESRLKRDVLERAVRDLGEVSLSDPQNLILKADIHLELGDSDKGIESLEAATRSDPYDHKTRFRLATLLFEHGHLMKAKEQVSRLLNFNSESRQYRSLMDRVKKKLEEAKESGRADELQRDKLRISTRLKPEVPKS